jgi:hypothetical protein
MALLSVISIQAQANDLAMVCQDSGKTIVMRGKISQQLKVNPGGEQNPDPISVTAKFDFDGPVGKMQSSLFLNSGREDKGEYFFYPMWGPIGGEACSAYLRPTAELKTFPKSFDVSVRFTEGDGKHCEWKAYVGKYNLHCQGVMVTTPLADKWNTFWDWFNSSPVGELLNWLGQFAPIT